MDLQAPVSSIMTPDPHRVHPEDAVAALHRIFKEHRLHHVPVIGEKDEVVGIISKSDFLYLLRGFTAHETDRFREEAMLRAFKVQEIMQSEVVTIRDDAPIIEAVNILSENRFRSLPVVDAEGGLVGIVTTHDIIDMVKALAE